MGGRAGGREASPGMEGELHISTNRTDIRRRAFLMFILTSQWHKWPRGCAASSPVPDRACGLGTRSRAPSCPCVDGVPGTAA